MTSQHRHDVQFFWNYWPFYYVTWPVIIPLNTLLFPFWLIQFPIQYLWNILPNSIETAIFAVGSAVSVTALSVAGATAAIGGIAAATSAAFGGALAVITFSFGGTLGLIGLVTLGIVAAALSPFAALGGSIYGIYAAVEAGKNKATTTTGNTGSGDTGSGDGTGVATPEEMGLRNGFRGEFWWNLPCSNTGCTVNGSPSWTGTVTSINYDGIASFRAHKSNWPEDNF